MDLAYCKGKAFSDSSMEEMERAIDSNLERRGMNSIDYNFGKKSQDSEAQASIDSELNYWQDFNPLDDKHKGRIRTIEARETR